MLVGYARVSTADQTHDLQDDALRQAGCTKIFHDVLSGGTTERPGLTQALSYVRAGDVLVVWKLDRLGRSLAHLITVIQELETAGIGFRSLQEQLDTTSAGGKLIFHIFGALAEFERALIRERTVAGLAAAKARGRVGGRPPRLSTDQIHMAERQLQLADMTMTDVAKALHVSRTTLYRALKKARQASAADRANF